MWLLALFLDGENFSISKKIIFPYIIHKLIAHIFIYGKMPDEYV